MECPRCRHSNLPGSSYCEKCGFHLKGARARPVPPAPVPMPAALRPTPAPAPAPAPARPPAAAAPAPPPARVAPRPAAAAPPSPVRATPPPAPARPALPRAFAMLSPFDNSAPVPLRWDRSLVGRESASDNNHPEIDLSGFPDAGVSRRHAQIVRGELHTTVEDLGSANGTFVNGQRLGPGSQHPISPGDELRFGSLRFRYQPNAESEHP